MPITRREWLCCTALAALTSSPVFAQSTEQVIVGEWGGDFANLLHSGVDETLMKAQGITVVPDISAATQRRTKLFAERQTRRGSMDVACLADFDMFAASKVNALEPISVANVPGMARVMPFLVNTYSIPHLYSAHVIVYRTDLVKVPPKSYADLWDPRYKNRVGLIDPLFTTNTAIAALVGGGSMTDFGPAKKKLEELNTLGAKVFPSTDSVAAALKSGDIWFTIVAAARGYMWRKDGIPLAHIVPQEGGFPSLYEAAVPKSARNKANGFKYLNAMLDPQAQLVFAGRMGYLPTVSDATLPAELDKEINFTEAEKARMLKVDYDYLQLNQAGILDVWTKTFRS